MGCDMATAHRLLFSDDFSRKRDEFRIDSGSWYEPISEHAFNVSGGNLVYTGGAGSILYTNNTFVDGEVRTLLRTTLTGSSGYTCSAGLLFRGNGNNHYRLLIGTNNRLYLYRVDNAVWTSLSVSPANITASPGKWNEVRLNMRGSVFTAYLNGVAAITATDATYLHGHVGVGANSCKFQVSDLAVYRNATSGVDYISFSETAMQNDIEFPTSAVNCARGGSTVNDHGVSETVTVKMLLRTSSVSPTSVAQFLDQIIDAREGLFIDAIQFTGSVFPSGVSGPTINHDSSKIATVKMSGIRGSYR